MDRFEPYHFGNLDDEFAFILKKYYSLQEINAFHIRIFENILYIEEKEEYIYFDKHIQDPTNTKFKINLKNIHIDFKIDPSYEKVLSQYYDLNKVQYSVSKNCIKIKGNDEFIYFDSIVKRDKIKYYNIIYNQLLSKRENIFLIQVGSFETLKKMYRYLDILEDVDQNYLIAVVEDQLNEENSKYLREKLKNSALIEVKNKGMDIGIFIASLLFLRDHNLKYKYLVKIHTKTDDQFREHVCDNLIGSKQCIRDNFSKMDNDPSIGMLNGTLIFNIHNNRSFFHNHMRYLHELSQSLLNKELNEHNLEFAVGTFFYSRFDVFDILDSVNLRYLYNKLNDFTTLDTNWYALFYHIQYKNDEQIKEHWFNNQHKNFSNNLHLQYKTECQGMRDNMIEHALERFFGYINKCHGYKMVEI